MQFLNLTRKFFPTQAKAQANAPRNFVVKRLSFLCLQLADASFCQFRFQQAKKQVFLVQVIFKDMTKVNIYATFLYLSKRFVILPFKTDFIADCIVKSRFLILHTTFFTVTCKLIFLRFYLSFLSLLKRKKCKYFQYFHNLLVALSNVWTTGASTWTRIT